MLQQMGAPTLKDLARDGAAVGRADDVAGLQVAERSET